MANLVFRKIRGRIIPLHVALNNVTSKHPIGVGLALTAGAGYAATKARQKSMEIIRGKGKKGTGSPVANFTLDLAGSAGILYGLNKYGGEVISGSLKRTYGFMTRSFLKMR